MEKPKIAIKIRPKATYITQTAPAPIDDVITDLSGNESESNLGIVNIKPSQDQLPEKVEPKQSQKGIIKIIPKAKPVIHGETVIERETRIRIEHEVRQRVEQEILAELARRKTAEEREEEDLTKLEKLHKEQDKLDNGLLPFGKYVPFHQINRGVIKDSTWTNYINLTRKIYPILNIPVEAQSGHENFYWEKLSEQANIDKILKYMLNNYSIKNGQALATKISPFRAIMMRINHIVPHQSTEIWTETVIQCRKKFDNILAEFGAKAYKPKENKDRPIFWSDAYEQLRGIVENENIDPRIRILASIYSYGYIFRMSIVFRTQIHDGDENYLIPSDDKNPAKISHVIDLKREVWRINMPDTGELKINPKMIAEIKSIMGDLKIFEKGWILPKKNGTPYSADASLSSFSSWSKAGLYSYRLYKKLYLNWISENFSNEIFTIVQSIIDHRNTNDINYMLPITEDD